MAGTRTAGVVKVDLVAETAKFQTDMKKAVGAFNSSMDRMKKSADRSLQGIRTLVAGVTAALGGAQLLGAIVEVNRKFSEFSGSLETVTGSLTAANSAMENLLDFAKTTPFTIDQSIQAFIKLKALGLDASERSMRSYGNTASAMGKSMTDMIEAVADASTFEFERLKEFGIKARQQADQVSFTFRGVTTTVKKEAAEITRFLQSIGETDFAGAMERQMKGLSGKLSNMSDSFTRLYKAIGDAGGTKLIGNLADHIASIANSMESILQSMKSMQDQITSNPNIYTGAGGFGFGPGANRYITNKNQPVLPNFLSRGPAGLRSAVSRHLGSFQDLFPPPLPTTSVQNAYGMTNQAVDMIRDFFNRPQLTQGMNYAGPMGPMGPQMQGVSRTTSPLAGLNKTLEKMNEVLQQMRQQLQAEVNTVRRAMMTERDILNERIQILREALNMEVINKEQFTEMTQYLKDEFNGLIDASRRSAMAMQSAFSDFFFDAMNGKISNFFESFAQSYQRIIADMLARNVFTALQPGAFNSGGFFQFLFGGGTGNLGSSVTNNINVSAAGGGTMSGKQIAHDIGRNLKTAQGLN